MWLISTFREICDGFMHGSLKSCCLISLLLCFNEITFSQITSQQQLPHDIDFLLEQGSNLLSSFPDSSLKYLEQAESILKEKPIPEQRAFLLNRKGLAYFYLGNLDNMLDCFGESMQIAESIRDFNMIGRNLCNLGVVYLMSGYRKVGINYYLQALPHLRKGGNLEQEALTLCNLSDAYIKLNNYDSALYYINLGLKSAVVNAPKYTSYAHYLKGIIVLQNKDIKTADSLARKALFLGEKYTDLQDIMDAYLLFSDIEIAKNEFGESVKFANKALATAETSTRLPDQVEAYDQISRVYELIGNYEQALIYRNKEIRASNLLQSNSSKNALKIFEFEKKKLEVEMLRNENQKNELLYQIELDKKSNLLNIAYISTAFITLIIAVILFNRAKVVKSNNKLTRALNIIQEKNEEINYLNSNLTKQVEEKTNDIIIKNKQLSNYAHFNAHELRAPVARILGIQVILDMKINEGERKFWSKQLSIAIKELDKLMHHSQKMLDEIENRTNTK